MRKASARAGKRLADAPPLQDVCIREGNLSDHAAHNVQDACIQTRILIQRAVDRRDFRHSRAVWCAVAGMCFSALSAIWDKFIFRHDAGAPADPHLVESVQLLFQVGLVVVYGLLLAAGAALGRRRARTGAPRFAWRWTIPCVGILLACADWLYFRGIHEDGVLISVASLMRRFSVVITFVLGAKFFHETNLLRKSLALAAVLLGIALICLGA